MACWLHIAAWPMRPSSWLREIIGDELSMDPALISVLDKPSDDTASSETIPIALFRSEWQLRAMASVCKDLILTEAAEIWCVEKSKLRLVRWIGALRWRGPLPIDQQRCFRRVYPIPADAY